MVDMPPETRPTDASRAFDPAAYQAELGSFVRRMGVRGDLDDVLQETFLRVVRSPPEGAPRAYLYSVALNVLRDRGRKEERAGRALPGAARIDHRRVADPADVVESRDLAARAWAFIERLPERQRAALILRIHEQFTYREAARALSCSEATARQHFYLGMKAVRAALSGENDD